MNIINKKLLLLSCTAASVLSVSAQESATGYFMENYNMKWQMNPAMGNRNGYVGFPGLGNMNFAVNGNFDVTSFVDPRNGKTLLFTNPEISAKEVLGNLHDYNRLSQNLDLNIIQFGFKAFGGYNNLAINVKENMSFDLPKSIFSLLKEGIGNREYDVKNLNVKAAAYAELVLNHSRDIKWVPGLRAGISLKLLFPAFYADANFNELALDLQKTNWMVRSNARVRVGLDGLKYELDENGHVNGVNTDDLKFGLNGMGFAFDLGATYKWREFNFSLALTDLGLINFNSVQEASTNGTKYFQTKDHVIEVGEESSFDDMTDDLGKLFELEDNGNIGQTSMGLNGKLRAGVDYEFPFYKKLHFGLLNTTQFSSICPSTEFRLSANVEPVKGVAASISGAVGTYGANYGFLLSLGNKGFNFLIGMDYAAFKVDKNFIPLSTNVDFHMGINFPF